VDHLVLLFVSIGQNHGTSTAEADVKFFQTCIYKKKPVDCQHTCDQPLIGSRFQVLGSQALNSEISKYKHQNTNKFQISISNAQTGL
jgi:hypothetical protein